MELASRIRWILILIVGVLLLFLIGWGLFTIASDLFSGDDSGSSERADIAYNVASTATAKLIVDGPIVANSEHRSYVIEVSQNVVSMKVFSNYGQTVIAEKSYRNNMQAYDAFLSSLENLQVTSRQSGTTEQDDNNEMGFCSNGRVFIVELDNNVRRWATSCSRREGTAGFSMFEVSRLFQLQVPDYRSLVRGTGL